jgi:predicted ABC-type exoprotein transport system permease subunit
LFLERDFVKIGDHIIDLCFGLDILITFKTTYVNLMTGDEEFNGKKIAFNYLTGRFWIDLLSTIPFEQLTRLFPTIGKNLSEKFVVISCLKLIRILRLNRLITYLNSSDDFKLQLRLIKLSFFLILYIHISACIWYFGVTVGNGLIIGKYDVGVLAD